MSLTSLLLQIAASAGWLWVTVRFLWPAGRVSFLDVLLFGVFFVVGAAWLLAAAYLTLVRLKYKEVRLDLAGPVRPGGRLVATLRAPAGFGGASAVTARLQCASMFFHENNLAGNRAQKMRTEKTVWSRQARFPVAGRECRIEFDLPADARPTKPLEWIDDAMLVEKWQDPGFRWQLDVHADVPGIDLVQTFPITVGKMAR